MQEIVSRFTARTAHFYEPVRRLLPASSSDLQRDCPLRTGTDSLGSAAAAAAATSIQSCPTLCDPIDGSPPRLPRPWDSPGKNTGVGCHFLLQCMKVKRESEVAQLCPTLQDPMDCGLPGSSAHGIFQARVLEWGAIAFSAGLHSAANNFPRFSNCRVLTGIG